MSIPLTRVIASLVFPWFHWVKKKEKKGKGKEEGFEESLLLL